MTFRKLVPCRKPYIGCANCGCAEMRREGKNGPFLCSLGTQMYHSFGGWTIYRNNKVYYRAREGAESPKEVRTLRYFENRARKDPARWKAEYDGALRDATYQRAGRNRWVLIHSGPGFA